MPPQMIGNGVDQDAQPLVNNWRYTMAQFNVSQEDLVSFNKLLIAWFKMFVSYTLFSQFF